MIINEFFYKFNTYSLYLNISVLILNFLFIFFLLINKINLADLIAHQEFNEKFLFFTNQNVFHLFILFYLFFYLYKINFFLWSFIFTFVFNFFFQIRILKLQKKNFFQMFVVINIYKYMNIVYCIVYLIFFFSFVKLKHKLKMN
jgi:hypothetical protein